MLSEKETEISQAEKKKTVADRKLASIESVIAQDREKVKEKQAEAKQLEAKIRKALDETQVEGSLDDAITEANEQIKILTESVDPGSCSSSFSSPEADSDRFALL